MSDSKRRANRKDLRTHLKRTARVGDTDLYVHSTSGFSEAPGRIKINGERIWYTDKASDMFLGCVRGADLNEGGSEEQEQPGGTVVYQDNPDDTDLDVNGITLAATSNLSFEDTISIVWALDPDPANNRVGIRATATGVGSTGPTGPTGPAGIDGLPGAAGGIGPTGPTGPAGTAGAAGGIGPTGPTGAAGTAGSAGGIGPTGPTGPAGTAGSAGTPGAAGGTGPTGPTGPTGTVGRVGPSCLFSHMKFSTSNTAADPGPGFIRLSNPTEAASGSMYVDTTAFGSESVDPSLVIPQLTSASTIKGYVRIEKVSDPTAFIVFPILGFTNNTGWYTLSLDTDLVHSTSSPFANNDEVYLIFLASGPKGDTGPTGPTGPAGTAGTAGGIGATGPTGPAGTAGTAGGVGPTGPTGPAGTNGTNGTNGTDGLAGPTGPTGPTGSAGPGAEASNYSIDTINLTDEIFTWTNMPSALTAYPQASPFPYNRTVTMEGVTHYRLMAMSSSGAAVGSYLTVRLTDGTSIVTIGATNLTLATGQMDTGWVAIAAGVGSTFTDEPLEAQVWGGGGNATNDPTISKFALQLRRLVYGPTGLTGPQGPTGPAGATGGAGPTGPAGAVGAAGNGITAATTTTPASMRLNEATNNGTNYIDDVAPASLSANYTHTRPAATGTIALVPTLTLRTNSTTMANNTQGGVTASCSGGETAIGGGCNVDATGATVVLGRASLAATSFQCGWSNTSGGTRTITAQVMCMTNFPT